MITISDLKEMFEAVFPDQFDLENITENSDLRKDIGMNSINLLYMAMVIEEKYHIQFNNDDFKLLNTVKDVIKITEGKYTK